DQSVQVTILTGNLTSQTFHDRNSHNAANTQFTSQLSFVSIQNAAGGIGHQQHVGQDIPSGEHDRLTRALIVLASTDAGLDELTSNLRRVIRGFLLEDLVDGEELLVGPNRTNGLLVDLVIRRRRTAITEQESASQFLIQHHPHLTTDHRDNIELGINQIVAIKLLLLVNGGRLGGTLQQTEDLLFLVLTLDVTLSTGLI